MFASKLSVVSAEGFLDAVVDPVSDIMSQFSFHFDRFFDGISVSFGVYCSIHTNSQTKTLEDTSHDLDTDVSVVPQMTDSSFIKEGEVFEMVGLGVPSFVGSKWTNFSLAIVIVLLVSPLPFLHCELAETVHQHFSGSVALEELFISIDACDIFINSDY